MPSHPRLIYPGVAVHIVQRGHNRNACFRGDSDYLVYLSHLRHLSRKYDCDLHAYCLMTNHVHLLLTPETAKACGNLLRDLGRSYVRYFNRRHDRSGTLWQSRYRSCIAESARYVLACYRYIELNPVRAAMVAEPGRYAWSSHSTNVGVAADGSITQHVEYQALGSDDQARVAAYRGLFDEVFDDELLRTIREATYAGYPLASDAFKSMLSAKSGRPMERGKPGPKTRRARRIITTLSRN